MVLIYIHMSILDLSMAPLRDEYKYMFVFLYGCRCGFGMVFSVSFRIILANALRADSMATTQQTVYLSIG